MKRRAHITGKRIGGGRAMVESRERKLPRLRKPKKGEPDGGDGSTDGAGAVIWVLVIVAIVAILWAVF